MDAKMIVKRLMSTQKAFISQKKPYQKPIYKSYRQLLNLDKPRKKIQHQSDNQNQNYLEKLLKQEKKKKKAKHSPHKKQNHNVKNNQKSLKKIFNNNQLVLKKQSIHQNLQVNEKNRYQNEKNKQELQKRNQYQTKKIEGSKKQYQEIVFNKNQLNQYNSNSSPNVSTGRQSIYELDSKYIKQQLKDNLKLQKIQQVQDLFKKADNQSKNLNPQISIFRVIRRRGLNSQDSRRKSQPNFNKDVFIDQKSCQIFKQNIYPFIIKNPLMKSSTAANLLKKQVHKKNLTQNKVVTQKIQNGKITHTIESTIKQNQKKNKFNNYSQLLPFSHKPKKDRSQLFKSLRQQELFINSLKAGPKTKFINTFKKDQLRGLFNFQ